MWWPNTHPTQRDDASRNRSNRPPCNRNATLASITTAGRHRSPALMMIFGDYYYLITRFVITVS
jgi:hypothetical protein